MKPMFGMTTRRAYLRQTTSSPAPYVSPLIGAGQCAVFPTRVGGVSFGVSQGTLAHRIAHPQRESQDDGVATDALINHRKVTTMLKDLQEGKDGEITGMVEALLDTHHPKITARLRLGTNRQFHNWSLQKSPLDTGNALNQWRNHHDV